MNRCWKFWQKSIGVDFRNIQQLSLVIVNCSLNKTSFEGFFYDNSLRNE